MRRGKIIWYMSYKPMCVRCKENLIVSGPWKEKCTATNEKRQSIVVIALMPVADVEREIQERELMTGMKADLEAKLAKLAEIIADTSQIVHMSHIFADTVQVSHIIADTSQQ